MMAAEPMPDMVCPNCGAEFYATEDGYEGETTLTSQPLTSSGHFCAECAVKHYAYDDATVLEWLDYALAHGDVHADHILGKWLEASHGGTNLLESRCHDILELMRDCDASWLCAEVLRDYITDYRRDAFAGYIMDYK